MSRRAKRPLLGVFDEQAVSVLAVLLQEEASFTELIDETGLSKASLSRVLKSLRQAQIVKRVREGYRETQRGREIILLVLKIAEEESSKATERFSERFSRLSEEYRATRRIFHTDVRWERTAEKALIEVMSMRNMTGIESLLFQQTFQEEAVREERWLKRSPTVR